MSENNSDRSSDSDSAGRIKETVEHTDVGVRLRVEHTRGSGTRNEDTVKAQVRETDWEQIEEVRDDVIGEVVETMDELREHQPDIDE